MITSFPAHAELLEFCSSRYLKTPCHVYTADKIMSSSHTAQWCELINRAWWKTCCCVFTSMQLCEVCKVQAVSQLSAEWDTGDSGVAWQHAGYQITKRVKEDRRQIWSCLICLRSNVFISSAFSAVFGAKQENYSSGLTDQSLFNPAFGMTLCRRDKWIKVAPSNIDPFLLFYHCQTDGCVSYSAIFLTLSY